MVIQRSIFHRFRRGFKVFFRTYSKLGIKGRRKRIAYRHKIWGYRPPWFLIATAIFTVVLIIFKIYNTNIYGFIVLLIIYIVLFLWEVWIIGDPKFISKKSR